MIFSWSSCNQTRVQVEVIVDFLEMCHGKLLEACGNTRGLPQVSWERREGWLKNREYLDTIIAITTSLITDSNESVGGLFSRGATCCGGPTGTRHCAPIRPCLNRRTCLDQAPSSYVCSTYHIARPSGTLNNLSFYHPSYLTPTGTSILIIFLRRPEQLGDSRFYYICSIFRYENIRHDFLIEDEIN
jgi:hypothetical protein